MENLSHSYSKRSYHNANGLTATASKSAYDDVFGGRTKFSVPTRSPRLEDYTEVFGGFHSSRPYCIPILDLPVAGNSEVEFPFDVRSSRFDYSEIFGGFRAVDFAVSYDDLLRQSSAGYDSSDDAWSPSPSELLSDESDPLACSEGHQSLFSSDKFFTVTDINLRTKPSQLPPPSRPLSAFAIKSGHSDKPNSSSKGSADYAFERIYGETSPPSFGEEVDTSSPTAALKDAIARAQAKCQRAKESMEKKKQGLQSCKGHSDNISTEDVTNGMFDEPAHCKDHRVTGKLEREDSEGEAFAEESEGERTEDDLVLDLSEGREHSNFYGKSSEGKKCKEYGLSQEAHRIEGTIAWREAVEFFEIETCPPGDMYESFKYGKHCMDAHDQKHLLGPVTEAFEQQETCKTFRHSKGAPEWEEDGKQVKMEKEVFEVDEQCGRSVKVSQNLFDLKLNGEVFLQLGLIGEVIKNDHRNVADLRESEQKTNKFTAKPKPNSTLEGVDDEESFTGIGASKINRKEPKSDFEKEECEGRCKDTVGKITRKNTVENELKQERRNLRHEETPEGEEKEEDGGALESNMKENQLKESIWLDKIDKKSNQGNENNINDIVMDLEQVQNKRDQDLACKREDEDKEMQDMFKWDQTHEHFTVKNEKPEEQNVNHEKEESKGGESEVRITKIPKQVQEEERFSLASESESENISEDSDELEEIECMIVDGGKLEELDENASYNEQITIDCESGEALDGACVSNDETVHVPLMHKVEKIFKKLETTQAAFSCDKNEVKITEGYNGELESEIGANNLLARERLNSFTDKEENMQYGKSNIVREVARKPHCLDAHFTNSKDVVNGMENSSFKREKIASEMACHSENLQTIYEGQNRINAAALQFTIYKEVDNEKFARHQMVRDGAENREKIRDALSVVQEDGEILSRIDQRSTNYCRGRKEMSSNECRNVVEQKFEILKKEKEPKSEYLRKIEAEREREREREKDLMAVSLNTLEKSYAEANRKIERAASEMWQRGTADVKKLVKASTEIGLRAEPAALERATAEAQQRASEKATAEKTAHDTRERVDTLSSHRFHTSSDNALMGQDSFSTDLLEHKNHWKSKLRYSYSSANAGIEGESPQRCKARLERYQRTAERAAKALAEKNMRDLLAQREQVERNRLAETLDAEVKRWSSGKEGNLRALLSTLQYILGPEISWHPIPLTEVITSAAVKKAFRKATLYVHPDKLQQRGASIQQKYICEKVFDLLKDAWNKFTSEEV